MSRGNNNFDAFRVIAAVGVVVSHAFLLSDGGYEQEPIYIISQGQTTVGGLAVLVFFVLSGYLITQSYDRSPNLRRFVTARALRIAPGLVAVVLLAAFVVGPIYSTLPPATYLAHQSTYRYIVSNLTFIWPIDTLPGVFTTNPFPEAVNGSLWTLRYEMACYALVLLLGTFRLLTKPVLVALVVAGSFALVAIGRAHSGIEFTTDFLAGAALYACQLRLRTRTVLVCAVLCGASLVTSHFYIVSATAGAVVIIYLATHSRIRLPSMTRYGDPSYGTYIYAFPVQQVVAGWLGPNASWTINLALSLPITLLLAMLSWHSVEKWALKWRDAKTSIQRGTEVVPAVQSVSS